MAQRVEHHRPWQCTRLKLKKLVTNPQSRNRGEGPASGFPRICYTGITSGTLSEGLGVPMRTPAKDYGVSDVALAKTCRKLLVPVPGRGYWARSKTIGEAQKVFFVNRV